MNMLKKILWFPAVMAAVLLLAGMSPQDVFAYARASAKFLLSQVIPWVGPDIPVVTVKERIAHAKVDLAEDAVELRLCSTQIQQFEADLRSLSEGITRGRRVLAAAVPVLQSSVRDRTDTVEFAGKRRPRVEFEIEVDRLIASIKADEQVSARKKQALSRLKERHERAQLRLASAGRSLQDAETKLCELETRLAIAREEEKQIGMIEKICGNLFKPGTAFGASIRELEDQVSKLEAGNEVHQALAPAGIRHADDQLSSDYNRLDDATKVATGN